MFRKLVLGFLIIGMATSILGGCGTLQDSTTAAATSTKIESTVEATNSSSVETKATTYPELDLNPTTALSVSADGVQAVAPSALTLSDAEIQTLKDGNFTVAFSYHTQSDTCNQTKLAAAKASLEGWGVEVVSVTDANFNAQTQVSDIESTMALKPDVLIVMPYDADATASALKANVIGTDTKIVFMENVATGFKPGTDYLACVSSDSYGNGKASADIMAKQLNYKGTVAMMFYDLSFYVTNERDRGFRETMEKYYPDIKIVMESGFTDVNNTGTVADAIFAKYPDINGIYASWDVPAEGAIATANSLGRKDIVITCCDLGDTAASMIATDGMIRGTGAPRSAAQGEAEALVAAYSLLGKALPSTFITPPALPVVKENLLDGYFACYGIEAPDSIKKLVEANK